MRVLGIDPGLDGALVLLDGDGLLEAHVMPTVGTTKRQLDEERLHRIILAVAPDLVALEDASARPGQGVASMFTFGRVCGLIWGIVIGMGFRRVLVRPQRWQRVMLAGIPPGEAKSRAYLACQRRWPGRDWRATARSRTPHGGLCDAALIAAWAAAEGGRIMPVEGIERDFKQRVSDRIRLVPEGPDRYRVSNPFLFDDGDHLVIVLKREQGQWKLTDEGHTYLHLGCDIEGRDLRRGTRQEIITNALAAFSVDDREGELVLTIPDGRFGEALHNFVQALVVVRETLGEAREC